MLSGHSFSNSFNLKYLQNFGPGEHVRHQDKKSVRFSLIFYPSWCVIRQSRSYKFMKSLLQTRSDKPAVNFFSWIARATVLMLLASAPAAVAQIYTFTFTGNDGIDASGTIDIVGGVAQSDSSINVINVPLEASTSAPLTTASGNLLTAGGDVRNHDGDVITYDTVVNPLNDPIFDNTGVCFASGFYGYDGGTPEYNALINIWGNGPGSYGMFIGEANPAGLES